MTVLSLRTLGELVLTGDDGRPLAVRRRELVLLAYVCSRGAPATRGELATLLWGDRGEARARHSLRQALVVLRGWLGDALDAGTDAVRLLPGRVELDTAAFEAEVRAGDAAAAVARWAGDFLAAAEEVGGEELRGWRDGERARLRRLLRSALEEWTAEAEGRSDWTAMAERAARWCEILPLDAAAEERRVEALRHAGRIDEALALHESFSARLEAADEVIPEEWRRLHQRMVRLRNQAGGARSSPATSLLLPDLVGRAAAFADLRAAWDAVRDGRPVVALVTGEEGSGKTRFTDEFLRWVETEQPDALVLRARGYEPERETPWSVARELLAPLRAAPGLGGADAGALAQVARLVPGVRERYRDLPEAGEDEHALHAAVLQVLLSVAAEVPVVVAVDDLPLADTPSRRLAIFLARRLGGANLLLLYTVRTGDAATHATTLELRDLPTLRRTALKPLRPAEVEAMLRSMLPLPARECRELAARLHSETGGNPLYIYELSAALIEAGHIEPDEDGHWRLSVSLLGPLPLPAGMRDVVARRLAQLSGAARDTLAAAAALGERFDAARLAAAGELAPREFSDALDELLTRRLLRDTPGRPGNYTFSHSIIRRVAYERLLPARSAAPPPDPPGSRRPWYRKLWQTPDAVFVDAGAAGEWLTARLRLAVMALLLILPTANLLSEPSYRPHRTGFVVTLLAVAVAVVLLQLLRRGGYRPWLGFLSSGLDVSLVSLGLASFIWAGDPHAAVNSKTTFEIYFLAVLAASLRYDRRICISAGAIAIAQYLAIVGYADARWDLNAPRFAPYPYGMFSWVPEIGRVILLSAAALLSWELVRRAQHLREMAVRDHVTGLFNRNFFETRARVELSRARRYGYDVAVALLEIPSPRAGERFGREAGEERLRALAERVRGVLREGDVIARYGIGEIALLLPEVSADEAARTLDFLRADLSCGVAGFPADGGHLEILVQVAERRAWTARYAREAASHAPLAAASA